RDVADKTASKRDMRQSHNLGLFSNRLFSQYVVECECVMLSYMQFLGMEEAYASSAAGFGRHVIGIYIQDTHSANRRPPSIAAVLPAPTFASPL
ncbi:MAG: hypothetical protein NTW45_07915, partial [Rhodocyclales bacterium]|nr:hypothetical protein [Rhodocyclales bacterium]